MLLGVAEKADEGGVACGDLSIKRCLLDWCRERTATAGWLVSDAGGTRVQPTSAAILDSRGLQSWDNSDTSKLVSASSISQEDCVYAGG